MKRLTLSRKWITLHESRGAVADDRRQDGIFVGAGVRLKECGRVERNRTTIHENPRRAAPREVRRIDARPGGPDGGGVGRKMGVHGHHVCAVDGHSRRQISGHRIVNIQSAAGNRNAGRICRSAACDLITTHSDGRAAGNRNAGAA